MPVNLDDMYPPCTYRGCRKTAVKRLMPPLSRIPWFGCADHYEDMSEALKQGAGTTGHVEVTDA